MDFTVTFTHADDWTQETYGADLSLKNNLSKKEWGLAGSFKIQAPPGDMDVFTAALTVRAPMDSVIKPVEIKGTCTWIDRLGPGHRGSNLILAGFMVMLGLVSGAH